MPASLQSVFTNLSKAQFKRGARLSQGIKSQINELLESGISLDALYQLEEGKPSMTLLMLAANRGWVVLADYLLQKNPPAKPDVVNELGESALYYAFLGHADMLHLLKHAPKHPVVMLAAQRGNIAKLRDLMNHVSLTERGTNGRTPLQEAVWYGQLDVVRLLMEEGTEAGKQMSVVDENGNSPLMNAVKEGHFAIAEFLYDYASNEDRLRAYLEAACLGRVSIMKMMVRHKGMPVDAVNQHGQSAMMLAAYYNQDIEVLFSELKASAMMVDNAGASALHYACEAGHQNMMRDLLNVGFDPEAVITSESLLHPGLKVGDLPIHVITRHRNAAQLREFLKYYDGAFVRHVDEKTSGGNTPLMILASTVDAISPEVAAVLRGHDASLVERDEKGQTALSIAIAANSQSMVSYLVGEGAREEELLQVVRYDNRRAEIIKEMTRLKNQASSNENFMAGKVWALLEAIVCNDGLEDADKLALIEAAQNLQLLQYNKMFFISRTTNLQLLRDRPLFHNLMLTIYNAAVELKTPVSENPEDEIFCLRRLLRQPDADIMKHFRGAYKNNFVAALAGDVELQEVAIRFYSAYLRDQRNFVSFTPANKIDTLNAIAKSSRDKLFPFFKELVADKDIAMADVVYVARAWLMAQKDEHATLTLGREMLDLIKRSRVDKHRSDIKKLVKQCILHKRYETRQALADQNSEREVKKFLNTNRSIFRVLTTRSFSIFADINKRPERAKQRIAREDEKLSRKFIVKKR